MRNRLILFFVVLAIIFATLLLVRKSSAPTSSTISPLPTESVLGKSVIAFNQGKDVCAAFPKVWVQGVIGIPISKTESFDTDSVHVCNYFVSANSFVSIHYESLNVERQKKGLVFLDRMLKEDPRIKMNHFIAWQANDLINNIYLVLGPNEYLTVTRSSAKAIDNETNILLAAAVSDRIARGEIGMASQPTAAVDAVIPAQQDIDVIDTFFNLIDRDRAGEAVDMMSTANIPNDGVKQAWAVNFNAIQSVGIKKITPTLESDWTEDRRIYQVILNLQMKPTATLALPIPNYGWDNGENTRWISLVKVEGKWYIDGIATGP